MTNDLKGAIKKFISCEHGMATIKMLFAAIVFAAISAIIAMNSAAVSL